MRIFLSLEVGAANTENRQRPEAFPPLKKVRLKLLPYKSEVVSDHLKNRNRDLEIRSNQQVFIIACEFSDTAMI